MKIIKHYQNLSLVISDTLLKKIYDIGHQHYPNEFGGILLGKYSDDLKKLLILESISPKKYFNSTIEFVRESPSTSELYDIYQDTGTYYVGEWHTHPDANSIFSKTDLHTMRNIAKSDNVMIKNPILLILSTNLNKIIDYKFYIFDNNNLEIYE